MVRRRGFHASTFLHPFAPRPLQALHHYYGCSDSCPGLRPGQVSLLHAHVLRAIPSPTTSCLALIPFSAGFQAEGSGPHRRGSPAGRPAALCGRRLRHSLAGSPKHAAESSSFSYGLASDQRLLSTSPHGDAVTVGFLIVQLQPGGGLPPPATCALAGALGWAVPTMGDTARSAGHGPPYKYGLSQRLRKTETFSAFGGVSSLVVTRR